MGIFEFLYKDLLKQKEKQVLPVKINQNRAAKAIEAAKNKKEAELILKIKNSIEKARKDREEYACYFSKIAKETKDNISKLEKQIEDKNTALQDAHQQGASGEFYKQYTTGQFVVSL